MLARIYSKFVNNLESHILNFVLNADNATQLILINFVDSVVKEDSFDYKYSNLLF